MINALAGFNGAFPPPISLLVAKGLGNGILSPPFWVIAMGIFVYLLKRAFNKGDFR